MNRCCVNSPLSVLAIFTRGVRPLNCWSSGCVCCVHAFAYYTLYANYNSNLFALSMQYIPMPTHTRALIYVPHIKFIILTECKHEPWIKQNCTKYTRHAIQRMTYRYRTDRSVIATNCGDGEWRKIRLQCGRDSNIRNRTSRLAAIQHDNVFSYINHRHTEV